ncbi:hypothetical protein M404DRAFT_1006007 [Pisolithus tinctorius Marx 270]|uniref:Uncharacterized protein n=1 Tax=Pisolithus tinctorius Marx 270 TaxID=870435 RepID=A0A0C3NPV5_PISTI|nr:hypothetical protein M404DRAFT_1006007 [Pisolithus tinctorius Marx 270]
MLCVSDGQGSGVCYTPSASWNSGGYKENPIEKPSNWAKGSQDEGSEHGKVTPEAPFRGLRTGRNPTLRARSQLSTSQRSEDKPSGVRLCFLDCKS